MSGFERIDQAILELVTESAKAVSTKYVTEEEEQALTEKVTEAVEGLDINDLVQLHNSYSDRTGYGYEVLVLDIEELWQLYGVNLVTMCARAGWKSNGGDFHDWDDFVIVRDSGIKSYSESEMWKEIEIPDIVEEIVDSIGKDDVDWFTDWIELTDLTD